MVKRDIIVIGGGVEAMLGLARGLPIELKAALGGPAGRMRAVWFGTLAFSCNCGRGLCRSLVQAKRRRVS